MKSSKFNYFIPHKGKYIFFNGMSKRFFFVSEKNYATFLDVVSHPDTNNYAQRYAPFLERMKREGFVLDKDTDEMELLRKKFEVQRYDDLYMLMILPTYKCNLSCWYCIQKHQDITLTDEIKERIKCHIKTYLLENDIKRFRLSWFGGEPLIAYKHLVDITSYAREFCKKHKIEFFCDITTNGILLTSERIVELRDLGIGMFQITIDGCREKHNEVKHLKNDSAFDKTIGNVLEIVKTIPDVYCVLRINYAQNTLEPQKIVEDLNGLIPLEYRKRITISPNRIWQLEINAIPLDLVSKMNQLLSDNHYRIEMAESNKCYVDFKHYNTIFPNGYVDKCEDEKLEGLKGVLTKSGNIEWNDTHPFEIHQALSENSECTECKHIAFCTGPCPKRRNDMIEKRKRIICQIPEKYDRDRMIQQFIIHYCESVTYNS